MEQNIDEERERNGKKKIKKVYVVNMKIMQGLMIIEDKSWEGFGKVIFFGSYYRSTIVFRIKSIYCYFFLEEYLRKILFLVILISII